MAHVQAQRWALAADSFRQIYELGRQHGVPRAPVALWDMGLALMRIPGREMEARDAFRRFLDESTTLTDDAQVRDWRSTALEHIAELEARVGAARSDGSGGGAGGGTQPGTTISPIGPIVLGVGLATVATGAVFGALALVREGELVTRCGGTACLNTPEHHAIYDEMRLFGGVTDVLLVVGGLVAATGLVLTFTLTESAGGSAPRARAGFGASASGAQLQVVGEF